MAFWPAVLENAAEFPRYDHACVRAPCRRLPDFEISQTALPHGNNMIVSHHELGDAVKGKVVIRLRGLDPVYLPPAKRNVRSLPFIISRIFAPASDFQLGPYLKSYDPDGKFGAGRWEFTDNKAEARVFADQREAFECWRAVSRVRPRRPDGEPNRPLTHFNVTFEEAL